MKYVQTDKLSIHTNCHAGRQTKVDNSSRWIIRLFADLYQTDELLDEPTRCINYQTIDSSGQIICL